MDEALPLPFNFDNELMNFVLSVSDLFSSDQEMLRVRGLRAGEYTLRIDSMERWKLFSGPARQGH